MTWQLAAVCKVNCLALACHRPNYSSKVTLYWPKTTTFHSSRVAVAELWSAEIRQVSGYTPTSGDQDVSLFLAG